MHYQTFSNWYLLFVLQGKCMFTAEKATAAPPPWWWPTWCCVTDLMPDRRSPQSDIKERLPRTTASCASSASSTRGWRRRASWTESWARRRANEREDILPWLQLLWPNQHSFCTSGGVQKHPRRERSSKHVLVCICHSSSEICPEHKPNWSQNSFMVDFAARLYRDLWIRGVQSYSKHSFSLHKQKARILSKKSSQISIKTEDNSTIIPKLSTAWTSVMALPKEVLRKFQEKA